MNAEHKAMLHGLIDAGLVETITVRPPTATTELLSEVTTQRDNWIETARMAEANAVYWRQRAEAAERSLMLDSEDGVALPDDAPEPVAPGTSPLVLMIPGVQPDAPVPQPTPVSSAPAVASTAPPGTPVVSPRRVRRTPTSLPGVAPTVAASAIPTPPVLDGQMALLDEVAAEAAAPQEDATQTPAPLAVVVQTAAGAQAAISPQITAVADVAAAPLQALPSVAERDESEPEQCLEKDPYEGSAACLLPIRHVGSHRAGNIAW